MRHTDTKTLAGNTVAPYVDAITECDQAMVYRCDPFTFAWQEGKGWCRLSTWPGVTWTPVSMEEVPGPFYECGLLSDADYSDYRNNLRKYHVN